MDATRAVAAWIGAELRRRWKAWAGFGVLLGLLAAPALAALAGGRRTNSVYPRFISAQRAWDVMVVDGSRFGDVLWKPDFAALARLPYVASSTRILTGDFHGFIFVGDTSSRYGTAVNRAKIVEGRLPRPDARDEVAVPYFIRSDVPDPVAAANRKALARAPVGASVLLRSADEGFPDARVTVVGRIVSPFDFQPNDSDAFGLVSASFVKTFPAFNGGSPSYGLDSIALRFQKRSDLIRFDHDLKAMTAGKAVVPYRQDANARALVYSSRLQGVALMLLAAIAGVTALLIGAQTIARQTSLESRDDPTLRALGASGRQMMLIALIRAGAIATIGAFVGMFTAWLASGLFPLGVFRLAEPSPGRRFDAVALLLAPLALVAVSLAAAGVASWIAQRSAASSRDKRSSRTADAVAGAGLPVAAATGVRLALERGGTRDPVPVRSTLAIMTLGIAAAVAALTVSGSTAHLLDTPRDYGKTWDKIVNFPDGRPIDDAARALAAQPDVEAIAFIDTGAPLTVDGRRIGGIMLLPLKGSLYPPILEGREPRAGAEVVVGTKTLRAIGKRVDLRHPQTVRVGIEGLETTISATIVGRAAIPPVSNGARFGEGLVASAGLPLQEILPPSSDVPPPTDAVVRFRAGSDGTAAVANVAKRFPGFRVGDDFVRRPTDVVDFGRVRAMPLIVSGVLVLIAAGALGHAVVSSARRRRRELAILKVVGFMRGQVRRAVAWQASTMTLVSLVVGIPLGVAIGRTLWRQITETLGVVYTPAVPALAVAALFSAAIVLANLIAAVPAAAAARTRPAIVLRAE